MGFELRGSANSSDTGLHRLADVHWCARRRNLHRSCYRQLRTQAAVRPSGLWGTTWTWGFTLICVFFVIVPSRRSRIGYLGLLVLFVLALLLVEEVQATESRDNDRHAHQNLQISRLPHSNSPHRSAVTVIRSTKFDGVNFLRSGKFGLFRGRSVAEKSVHARLPGLI